MMGKVKSGESSREEKRSHKKKHKKEKKKKRERSSKKRSSKEEEDDVCGPLPPSKRVKETSESEEVCGPLPPPELAAKAKSFAPMRKEDWEKQQNVVRRVYDEETGRSRLVKGDGEILEEIVSRDRHKEINRKATFGDGQHFQSVISQNVKK